MRLTILDLEAEIEKLTMRRGRTPQMTEADRQGTKAFATLAPFRDGNIYTAKYSGGGAWERHPNGDQRSRSSKRSDAAPHDRRVGG